jgi:hypothetical protein
MAMPATIQEIDRTNVRLLMGEADRALAEIAHRYGLAFSRGSATFDTGRGTVKASFEFKLKTTRSGRSQEQVDFEADCRAFGLRPDQYRQKFVAQNEEFELVAIARYRPVRPFLARRVRDGKEFSFKHALLGILNAGPAVRKIRLAGGEPGGEL